MYIERDINVCKVKGNYIYICIFLSYIYIYINIYIIWRYKENPITVCVASGCTSGAGGLPPAGGSAPRHSQLQLRRIRARKVRSGVT